MKKKVIVIGSGVGGLSIAILLAKKGYQVTVLEKNASFGGRGGVFSAKGFQFDMGPSWYLMPDIFEHFFSLIGEKTEDYFKLKRLDPSYKIWFEEQKQAVGVCIVVGLQTYIATVFAKYLNQHPVF